MTQSHVATSYLEMTADAMTAPWQLVVCVHKRRSAASIPLTAMGPTENSSTSGKGQGTKQTLHPGPLCGNGLSPLPWPFDPGLQRLTVYFGPSSSRVHRCCLPEWRKPETRGGNLITETIMSVTQADPDLYSNGLIYLELQRCICRGPSVNPETPVSLGLFVPYRWWTSLLFRWIPSFMN